MPKYQQSTHAQTGPSTRRLPIQPTANKSLHSCNCASPTGKLLTGGDASAGPCAAFTSTHFRRVRSRRPNESKLRQALWESAKRSQSVIGPVRAKRRNGRGCEVAQRWCGESRVQERRARDQGEILRLSSASSHPILNPPRSSILEWGNRRMRAST